MGMTDKELFWWRVRRWQVVVPNLMLLLAAGFLWSHTQGFEFARDRMVECQIAICFAFIVSVSRNPMFPGRKPKDEREKILLLRHGYNALCCVSIYLIVVLFLCNFHFDFPSLWAPQTKEDWHVIQQGFTCVTFGGMMISYNMTALPPLGEEEDGA